GRGGAKMLNRLCDSLCRSLTQKEVLERIPDGLQDVCSRLTSVCRCFVLLLQSDAAVSGTGLSDLEQLRKYSGSHCLETSLKAALAKNEYFNSLAEDALKFAAGTVKHSETYKTWKAQIGKDLSLSEMKSMIDEIGTIKNEVRPGLLDKIEVALLKELKKHAHQILACPKADGKALESFAVVSVGLALPGFEKQDGTLDLQARLKQWKNANKDAVDLLKLDSDPSTMSFQDLHDLIGQLRNAELSDTAVRKLLAFVPRFLSTVKDEVMDPQIPHAAFKQRWHSLKLCCTKLVVKVLTNETSDYLCQLCDLIYYGSHIVWEQRRFDSAANPAEKQKAGEALAKSIRGMLNCQSKTLQAEQNASGSEDGEDLGL
ncbi:unnamed protein product, partial [Symbiodinium sp. CCMP2456]